MSDARLPDAHLPDSHLPDAHLPDRPVAEAGDDPRASGPSTSGSSGPSRPSGLGRALHRALAAVLAAGLLLGLPGCDSSGANGGGNGDGGDGDDPVVPAAPSGLEAAPGDGEVSLGWNAVEEAQTYNVYRDTESGTGASGSPLEEGISETSYTDQSAENGTTYYYVVTGVADEEGDPSGEAQATPESDAVVPAAPSGLEATPGDGEVSLGWEAAEDAQTYNVYRDTESGTDASGSPLEEGISETSYADQSAENGTEYFYVVTGVAGEEGDPSGEAEGAPFTSPSGLEKTPGDSRVDLSWEAAAGAETYNVYRDTESGVDTSGSPLEGNVSETAFADETAENGTTYYYVVTSVNPNGEEGDGSEEAEAVPFAPPSGLEGTPGDSQVELSWSAAAGAESYNVHRDTESGIGASGEPLAESVEETAFADETAENGTEYFYVVTSVNVSGEESAESGEAEGAPFASPSGLEGTSGDSQVELSWEAAAGAETYNVYRSTESGVDTSGSPLAEGISETSYTDESAENGTTYYYVVTSANPNGEESGPSNEVKRTPFADPPGTPGGS